MTRRKFCKALGRLLKTHDLDVEVFACGEELLQTYLAAISTNWQMARLVVVCDDDHRYGHVQVRQEAVGQP